MCVTREDDIWGVRSSQPRSRSTVSSSFSYSVTTKLPRDRVWKLLSDIDNWPRVADVYAHVHWQGAPWIPGSSVMAVLVYPIELSVQYLLERCEPPSQISYLAHSHEAGFASHRTIELAEVSAGTLVRVSSYVVGEPALAGGGPAFLKMLTQRWFDGFAHFCDEHHEKGSEPVA